MATLVNILFALDLLEVSPPEVTKRNPAYANIIAAIGRANTNKIKSIKKSSINKNYFTHFLQTPKNSIICPSILEKEEPFLIFFKSFCSTQKSVCSLRPHFLQVM
jgi:hypothetical protein